ncbi:MAG TPA: hypothetical protein VJQ59_00975 [Candidatus Sulfotelmatobacter sp.]|nr:hypothetical protein [Candidatus Sulfotelmatobacter sp.]
MAKRILLTAVLGGLAMFLWSSIAHMALGLGSLGVQDIPNEQAMIGVMKSNLAQSGFYFFPGLGLAPGASRAERNAAMNVYQQKVANGPSGILIYHPSGQKAISAGQLLTEFGTNVVQALLAAILLAFAGLRAYGARVGFVGLAGVMAGITTNISYWTWYGFPGSYTAGYAFTEIMGYVCIGLVAAAIVKNSKPVALSARAA